jgi:hypothetical protein
VQLLDSVSEIAGEDLTHQNLQLYNTLKNSMKEVGALAEYLQDCNQYLASVKVLNEKLDLQENCTRTIKAHLWRAVPCIYGRYYHSGQIIGPVGQNTCLSATFAATGLRAKPQYLENPVRTFFLREVRLLWLGFRQWICLHQQSKNGNI